MKRATRAILFGLGTEIGVMLFAVLSGSYATPVFTSSLSESGFDIAGRLFHFPGHQFMFLLFGFLHRFDWHLGWWSQLFWLFSFQAVFWSVLWFAFYRPGAPETDVRPTSKKLVQCTCRNAHPQL